MKDRERFLKLCVLGFKERNVANDERFKVRFKKELKEIDAQGEHEYFLNLYDKFRAENLKFPENQHNNLTDYLLGLTDQFDIEKPSAYLQGEFPDIDIDYLKPVRDYIKRTWASATFGQDYICEIGTYGTSGIKSAILDMARIYSADKETLQQITNKMADKDDEGHELDWDKAMEIYPAFKEYCDNNPLVADAARMLLDRIRSGGVHAGGLIISSARLDGFVPLEVRMVNKDNPNGVICSAWTEGLNRQDLGPVGLIKFDLLVISNLMQIALCCKLIKERHGIDKISALPGQWDFSDISYLNDPKAIEMADKADLKCIFQFDSEGIRKLVKRGGVSSFDDLAAYSALYRPGPLNQGMDVTYCRRKKGEEPYNIHPIMEKSLSKTYGVLCIHKNTFVSMADGREVQIKNVKIGDLVHSLNVKNRKIEVKECHGCAPSRFEDGYLLTLSNGYSVILTGDHEVQTWNGMKRVDALTKQDIVACPEFIPQVNKSFEPIAEWLGSDENVAYLLGQLTGDGCLTSCGVTISCGLQESCDLLHDWICKNLPKIKVHKYFHCRSWYLNLSSEELLKSKNHGNRKSKLSFLLDCLKMKKTSWHKRVPEKIMMSPEPVRLAFLAGLIDSDGSLPTDKKNAIVSITSVSDELLNDVRKILSMSGILCTMAKNRVYIWNQLKLSNLISKYLVIKNTDFCQLSGEFVGDVPRDVIREIWQKSNMSQRDFASRYDISRSSLRKNKDFSTSHTYKKLGGDLGDIRYYAVSSVEIIPNQQFYSMSVQDNHNLIANGIVVKNCYQEQIMDILRIVGQIPDMHTEKVRKAISKKKVKEFMKYKEMFIENGQKTLNANAEYVSNLWDQVQAFSEYGFNKSHSYAYTYISSRLLYLKAHYPLEFYTSILMCENDTDKFKEYKLDAERHGIDVCPVHINKSRKNFGINDEKIYFGFSNIKGIGDEVSDRIVSNQPYSNISDFLERFGVDATPIKAFTSLGVFEEKHDRLTLRKFAEYYKKQVGLRKDRKKRFEASMDKKLEDLKKLLLEEIKETDQDFEKMCDFTPEAEELWERRFVGLMRQVPYKYKGEERLREVSYLKMLQNIASKRQGIIESFQEKELGDEETEITINHFDPDLISIDEEEEKILKDELIIDGKKSYPMAESIYYGFQWTHILETSPDYDPSCTIDQFLEDAEKGMTSGPVHVQIKSVKKRTSAKGTEFWTVGIEDANGKQMNVNVWRDDYMRFKEELVAGQLVAMTCNPPGGGFNTLTFKGVPRHERKYLGPKEADGRLVVLRLPEKPEPEKEEVILDDLVFDENAIDIIKVDSNQD